MEVGVFPADPRAIAAAEAFCVSLLVPLVIGAAKILIPDVVVRRPAMYPQMIMSSVSREHWRGHNG
jgi:hypothetical protein